MPVLEVQDLRVHFRLGTDFVHAVDGVDLSLEPGENLGLVGESGSGKTTLGYALMRLLPDNAVVKSGRVMHNGRDLLAATDSELRAVRWRRIAMVFQNAMAAMNPVFTVGDQIAAAMKLHFGSIHEEARKKAAHLFERVGVHPSRLDAYPHELSGGQRQRAMIAMALACDPEVLIADEPTTALDVVAQTQVLELLRDIQKEYGLSVILISHDLGAVANLCQQIAVLYAGQVVELNKTETLLNRPRHPYTQALLNAYPRIETEPGTLWAIPGTPPSLVDPPAGCRFAERCPIAQDVCREAPPIVATAGGWARCHFADRETA